MTGLSALLVDWFKKAVKSCPSLLVRWYFSKHRMQEYIVIDIRPNGEQLTIDLGDFPAMKVWLRITNFSPLPVTLTHVWVRLNCLGNDIKLERTKRTTVLPLSSEEFVVEKDLGGRPEQRLRLNAPFATASIGVEVDFDSDVRKFTKNVNSIQGVHVAIQNCPSELACQIQCPNGRNVGKANDQPVAR